MASRQKRRFHQGVDTIHLTSEVESFSEKQPQGLSFLSEIIRESPGGLRTLEAVGVGSVENRLANAPRTRPPGQGTLMSVCHLPVTYLCILPTTLGLRRTATVTHL